MLNLALDQQYPVRALINGQAMTETTKARRTDRALSDRRRSGTRPNGSVFHGTDLRTNQPVAIKAPQMAAESDPVFFERFRREAEIGRKLDHPGVVKVFPREDRDGVYMVMEWVDGPLLR